jgi:hypothetical protein
MEVLSTVLGSMVELKRTTGKHVCIHLPCFILIDSKVFAVIFGIPFYWSCLVCPNLEIDEVTFCSCNNIRQ